MFDNEYDQLEQLGTPSSETDQDDCDDGNTTDCFIGNDQVSQREYSKQSGCQSLEYELFVELWQDLQTGSAITGIMDKATIQDFFDLAWTTTSCFEPRESEFVDDGKYIQPVIDLVWRTLRQRASHTRLFDTLSLTQLDKFAMTTSTTTHTTLE